MLQRCATGNPDGLPKPNRRNRCEGCWGHPQGSSLRMEKGGRGPEDFEGKNGKSTSEKMGLWKCLGEGDIPREGPDGWRRAFAWP